MSMPQISVQGIMYDHTSVRVDFMSTAVIVPPQVKNYIKSITWSHDVASSAVHGAQVTPMGGTLGPYMGHFSFTIIKEGWDLFMTAFPLGYFTFVFDSVAIDFVNPLATIPAHTDINQVRIIKVDNSSSQGGKELEVKVDCLVTGQVIENGIPAIPTDQDLVSLV